MTHPALRPDGFHPLLRGEAALDRRITNKLLDLWQAQGFEQVSPIQVDQVQALFDNPQSPPPERCFQFLDPASGDLLALLPDVTLGITRLAAGELADAPRPLKLSYAGQAIRTHASNTRPVRQFGQIGVELIGAEQSQQAELLHLALSSLYDLGLRDMSLSLVLPTFAAQAMNALNIEPSKQAALAHALDQRDEGRINQLAGDKAPQFHDILRGDFAKWSALQALAALGEDLKTAYPALHVHCAAFEQRGFHIQTGTAFALYAQGIEGEIGRGGAYVSHGESCFGFSFYRDTLLRALPAASTGA